jgi:UDP-N-acetylmuramoyl-L-alanyl-D-glutamate--2,6-diaminopimelate ligase
MKLLQAIKKIIPKKIFKIGQPPYHFLLSAVSALFYGFPSNNLIVIGVTGTTGKTTSVYMIAKALESAGIKTGFTSTAMFNDGKKEWTNDKKMTMIGRFFTQRILKKMHMNGCQVAVIETTSEGIKQYRHRFINYDIAVFTGLYEEHIESHGSFLKYKEAKGKLFAHLGRCGEKYIDEKYRVKKALSGLGKTAYKKVKKTIVVNGDDEHADYFLKFSAERKIVYSEKNKKTDLPNTDFLNYGNIKTDEYGIFFDCGEEEIRLNLLGDFNAVNAMNAIGVGLALDLPLAKIKDGLEKIKGIAGRLELINEGQKFNVIVDYAFEPKAMEKLYNTVKKINHKKIIHVLGSTGGGRDVARRPILGELAGKNADLVIVTNEDPYDDDPMIIIDQVALGAERAGKKKNQDLFLILDRKEAIKKALDSAQDDDMVLITGKGNEQAICVANGEKIPWDDREVTRELLK